MINANATINKIIFIFVITMFLLSYKSKVTHKKIGIYDAVGNFINGTPVGLIYYYDTTGILEYTKFFDKGMGNGKISTYFLNKKVRLERNLVKDVKQGYERLFDSTGNLLLERFYQYGHDCGPTETYINGKLNRYKFTTFDNDFLLGFDYNSNGSVKKIRAKNVKLDYQLIKNEMSGDSSFYNVFFYAPYPPKLDFSYKYFIKDSIGNLIYTNPLEKVDFLENLN